MVFSFVLCAYVFVDHFFFRVLISWVSIYSKATSDESKEQKSSTNHTKQRDTKTMNFVSGFVSFRVIRG